MDRARSADLPIQRQQARARSAAISEQLPQQTSRDIWVMFSPRTAFHHLVRHHDSTGAWTLLRRPLFLAFLIGCTLSLGTSGVLTARLVFSTAASWSFVPLFEVASLLTVCCSKRRTIPLSRAVDLFFAGHAPWTVALLGLGAITCWMSPIQANIFFRFLWNWRGFLILGAIATWSAWIDFHFFQIVLGLSPGQARRSLVLHRVIAWSCGIAYMFAFPLWPLMVGWFQR